MTKKGFLGGILVLALVFGFMVVGCASAPPVGMGLMPNSEYATVTINRSNSYSGSAVSFNIYIDNQKVESVKNGSATKFLVKNGIHSIYIGVQGMRSPVVTFTADSNEFEFTTYLTSGLWVNTLNLVQNATNNTSQ